MAACSSCGGSGSVKDSRGNSHPCPGCNNQVHDDFASKLREDAAKRRAENEEEKPKPRRWLG